jgi:hypothetical protein
MEHAPEKWVSVEWGHIILKSQIMPWILFPCSERERLGSRVKFQSERDVSTVSSLAGWATGQPRDFEHGSPESLLDGLMKCIVPVTYRRRRRSTTTGLIVRRLFPLTFISATTHDNVDRFQYPRSARRQVEAQEGREDDGPTPIGLNSRISEKQR